MLSLEKKVPAVLRDPQTPLGRAGVLSFDAAREGRALQQRLYGSPGGESFRTNCNRACRGFLYDILHFEDVKKTYGAASSGAALYLASTRDGRAPYLIFVLIVLILAGIVLWILVFPNETSNGTYQHFLHYAPTYPNIPTTTTNLGLLCRTPFRT